MMTAKDYAKKKKISLRAARSRLDEFVHEGKMQKKRGPSNLYMYYEVNPSNFRWHDPFNRCKQDEMARPV
jgi:hypothetical protein